MKIVACNHPEPHLCFRGGSYLATPSNITHCISKYYKNCKHSEPKEVTLSCLSIRECKDKAKGVCTKENFSCLSQGYLVENESDLYKRLINAITKI